MLDQYYSYQIRGVMTNLCNYRNRMTDLSLSATIFAIYFADTPSLETTKSTCLVCSRSDGCNLVVKPPEHGIEC